jgi:hypothetical protein
MLEHPPIATEQEKLNAFKVAFELKIQRINSRYPYWDEVKYMPTKDK